jgi:hypothetical protein
MTEQEIVTNEVSRRLHEHEAITTMLMLCGELDGKKPGESNVAYLRRLIDGLIEAQKPHDLTKKAHRFEIWQGMSSTHPNRRWKHLLGYHDYAKAIMMYETLKGENPNERYQLIGNVVMEDSKK